MSLLREVRMRNWLFWVLFAATLVVYAAMLGWSLPTVSAAAGGLPPFDLRPGGYSLEEAQQFLTALSPDGAAFYLDVQHMLDMLYPPLSSLTMFFALAWLLPRGLGVWRFAFAAPALVIAVFDHFEDAAVTAML